MDMLLELVNGVVRLTLYTVGGCGALFVLLFLAAAWRIGRPMPIPPRVNANANTQVSLSSWNQRLYRLMTGAETVFLLLGTFMAPLIRRVEKRNQQAEEPPAARSAVSSSEMEAVPLVPGRRRRLASAAPVGTIA